MCLAVGELPQPRKKVSQTMTIKTSRPAKPAKITFPREGSYEYQAHTCIDKVKRLSKCGMFTLVKLETCMTGYGLGWYVLDMTYPGGPAMIIEGETRKACTEQLAALVA